MYVAKNFRVREVIAYVINPKALATSIINARLSDVEDKSGSFPVVPTAHEVV